MDVIESLGIWKTARRNLMWGCLTDIKINNNKNNKLNIFNDVFYKHILDIVPSVYVFVTRGFKALFNEGSQGTRLFDWLYFKAFKALKELKNTPTSQKSHDQV
tara:strand:- start:196 stop:504 length:309 start_codon:yes stop_codon:yes gene_type:complete